MESDPAREDREVEVLRQHRLKGPVLVADHLPTRLRRPEDLLEALFALCGILLVILVGLYAHSTTQGVAEDVREALGGIVRQILRMPVTVIESLFVIVSPAAVLISLARKGRYRSMVNAIVTGAIAAITGWILVIAIPHLPSALVDSLLVRTPTGGVISLDVVITVLAAALTVAADASQSSAVRFSWVGIWFLLVVSLIWGTATVPGMIVTVLLGRMIGCLARWGFGFDDRRALPADLVQGILDMGLSPSQIIRADVATDVEPLESWEVFENDDATSAPASRVAPRLLTRPIETSAIDSYEMAPPWGHRIDRNYRLWTTDGRELELHVMDPGSALTSTLGDLWNNIRLRGFTRWISPAILASAERAVLAAKTAAEAEVKTPRPLGISRAGDSVVVAWESTPLLANLLALHDAQAHIPDHFLAQAWLQLLDAHSRGVAHRNLDVHSLGVDAQGRLWILDWHEGEVASTDLSRQIDCAQMLAHLSLAVGTERALASAMDFFSASELTAIAVVMQSAIMPPEIRRRLRKTDILDNLRSSVAQEADVSAEDMAPAKLVRFAPRTLILFAVGAFALFAAVGSLNFTEIIESVKGANPWWILVAFLLSTLIWLGSAIPLVAFAPVKLPFWRTTLVQIAASIVSLVAPAGIGPAAMNLRYLTKEKVKLPLAVASVTLVQISQVITSVFLLVVIAASTGTSVNLPIPSIMTVWIVAAVGAGLAGLLAITKIRTWLWTKARDIWEQIRPQLLWLIGHPQDLAKAFFGNVLMNIGFIGAFAASLAAFDYDLSILTVTITFLLSNTVGSAIPSPGGIGTTEAALTAGLQVAGVPPAIAVPTVLLYRLLTFYGRVPFAWIALHFVQKKGYV